MEILANYTLKRKVCKKNIQGVGYKKFRTIVFLSFDSMKHPKMIPIANPINPFGITNPPTESADGIANRENPITIIPMNADNHLKLAFYDNIYQMAPPTFPSYGPKDRRRSYRRDMRLRLEGKQRLFRMSLHPKIPSSKVVAMVRAWRCRGYQW